MPLAHVATTPAFAVLSRERLFNASNYFESPWAQSYDVTPDGSRFLMLRLSASTAGGVSPMLVRHFLGEVQRLLP
jgi:hypothetical protein